MINNKTCQLLNFLGHAHFDEWGNDIQDFVENMESRDNWF